MCGNNFGILHQATFAIDTLLLLSVCVQSKNGHEWKFQILFLDPLAFTSQISHHIPIVLFYSFACQQELHHQGTTTTTTTMNE